MSVPNYLRVVEKNPDREAKGFAVCDIEVREWVHFLVIGYYTKFRDEDGCLKDEVLHNFTTMAEFCDYIFTSEQKHSVIYAHFGGKFDFNFILKELYYRPKDFHIHDMIPRGSGLLCFSVSTIRDVGKLPSGIKEKDIIKTNKDHWLIKDRTIEFRDSSAMLPFGLKSLTENFGVDHLKQEIDYDKIKKVTPELLRYLKYDLKGLYEVIEKYYEWPMIKAAGARSTMASQAMRVFQTYLKKDIPSLPSDIDNFVRGSYFGGRTEIFKPAFMQCEGKSLLKTYDVNSLYPAIMRDMEMPTHFDYNTKRFEENKMGFYDVDVFIPDMYVPPLGTVFDPEGWGRFIFPTGTFRGCFTSMELNYAMTLGGKILKVHRGMIFRSNGFIFREYINDLYAIRKASKKESVDNVLCKLLMNSTYGRFGLNRNREQIEFERGQMGVDVHQEIHIKNNEYIRLMKKEVYLDKSFANVAIASWVTSGARMLMHKLYMQAPEALYYTDTDSMFSTHTYPDNDTDLGQLKLEYQSRKACFLLPKTYIVDTLAPQWTQFDDNGKPYKSAKKTVMKGFDKKKISKFELDDFYAALEGEMRHLKTKNPAKFATFKTAMKKQEFVTMIGEQDRELRSKYDKRRIVKRDWAQVYDTEPLHIKDGEIVNMIEQGKRR